MRFFPLVLRNVVRKRTRSFLTIASIVLPLVVICFFGTFLRAIDRPDPAQARGMFRLVTRHKASLSTPLPQAYLEKVRRLPGVLAATTWTFFGGRYKDGRAGHRLHAVAADTDSFLPVYDDARLVAGSVEAWKADRTGCLVGRNLANKYGWSVGTRIPLIGDAIPLNPVFTVRGIFEVPDGSSAALFFHKKYLDEAYPPSKGLVGTIWLKVADAAAADRLSRQIDATFENSPWPTQTESEKAFQMGFVSMLGNVKLVLGSIGAIVVVVIVLIAANTMAMSARERITEVAVLRTLGFTRARVLGLLLAESVVIGVLGGALGVALFAAAEPWLRRILMGSPMAMLAGGVRVQPQVVAAAFAIALAVGLVAGVFPAVRSASRPIVEGLRAS